MKVIQLTIEWPGMCSEEVWAECLKSLIENHDDSRGTKVTGVNIVTHYGTTGELPESVWVKVHR